jgi:hypothetical protein
MLRDWFSDRGHNLAQFCVMNQTLRLPDTPMEIATEMAHLALEMRGNTLHEKQRKQRLELLAEHFQRITGQENSGSIFDTETEDSHQRRITLN